MAVLKDGLLISGMAGTPTSKIRTVLPDKLKKLVVSSEKGSTAQKTIITISFEVSNAKIVRQFNADDSKDDESFLAFTDGTDEINLESGAETEISFKRGAKNPDNLFKFEGRMTIKGGGGKIGGPGFDNAAKKSASKKRK
jgi:hypothetical protein